MPASYYAPWPLWPVLQSLKDREAGPESPIESFFRRYDAAEPEVRAFVPGTVHVHELRQQADELAARYRNAQKLPPLCGIPVGVKDLFRTDGFETRAGSELPAELFAGPESSVVARLKEAGCLIPGKTVTTEFAFSHPGPTCNPANPGHTPGGSSSGSAAAVASGMVPLALGTQTVGSITRPAAFCGICGFKPTIGRIARDGVFPFSYSADHVGFFVAHAGDVETIASLLCYRWSGREEPLSGPLTVGIPHESYLRRAGSDALAHFEETVTRLGKHGIRVRKVTFLEDFSKVEAAHRSLIAAEFATVHHRLIERYGELYHSPSRALFEEGMAVSREALSAAWERRELLRAEYAAATRTNGLDAWISPAATGPAPPGLSSTGDPVMNLPWTFLGAPALAIPAGQSDEGLPLGLQIAGPLFADEALVAAGRQISSLVSPGR